MSVRRCNNEVCCPIEESESWGQPPKESFSLVSTLHDSRSVTVTSHLHEPLFMHSQDYNLNLVYTASDISYPYITGQLHIPCRLDSISSAERSCDHYHPTNRPASALSIFHYSCPSAWYRRLTLCSLDTHLTLHAFAGWCRSHPVAAEQPILHSSWIRNERQNTS